MANKPIRWVFHAGTPKTGSSSLQFIFDNHRELLLQNGILYPSNVSRVKEPKHQWFVSQLINGDIQGLIANLESALMEAGDNTHTIILSSEGIYNHWWDFPDKSKQFLNNLANTLSLIHI